LGFVDQRVAEHALVASAHGSGVAQELQGADLHIVEVECAARQLEGFVLAQVRDGQLQQGAGDVAGALLQRGVKIGKQACQCARGFGVALLQVCDEVA
jgi:hypothetical protein